MSPAPFAVADELTFGGWAYDAVGLGAVVSCFGTVNGFTLLQRQVPQARAKSSGRNLKVVERIWTRAWQWRYPDSHRHLRGEGRRRIFLSFGEGHSIEIQRQTGWPRNALLCLSGRPIDAIGCGLSLQPVAIKLNQCRGSCQRVMPLIYLIEASREWR